MTTNDAESLLYMAKRAKNDEITPCGEAKDDLVAAAVIVGFMHLAERMEEKLDEIISQMEYSR